MAQAKSESKSEAEPDTTFTETIQKHTNGWTCVFMAGSGDYFGTRKAIKVGGLIDGEHEFKATLMPMGDGTHMVPINTALKKAIKKDVGDEITVRINARFS
ncbi:DUF1905 domain-containing protein [Kineosporia succinea]|uniref:DUF1905 domain-containing protein n=1 Tax=Kineosporia succinea TaxID=84632 RepID=A0ABT9PAE4_9ACTN|nr:DUF1905 domain-containing protein [Kineosporia succinea]MDP9829662.1 hypothetical protein [Kineosporia succinea]